MPLELGDGVVLERVGVTGVAVERFFFGEVTTTEAVGAGEEGDGPHKLFVAAVVLGALIGDDLESRVFFCVHVGGKLGDLVGVLSVFEVVVLEWVG